MENLTSLSGGEFGEIFDEEDRLERYEKKRVALSAGSPKEYNELDCLIMQQEIDWNVNEMHTFERSCDD